MEKHGKAIQVYGYTVCVIAVITFLIASGNFVFALMDLQDPMHADNYYQLKGNYNLASYDIYRVELIKSIREAGNDELTQTNIPDDQTIKAMYDAAKDERIQTGRHKSTKNLTVNGFLIAISIILFATHWIWLRRKAKAID